MCLVKGGEALNHFFVLSSNLKGFVPSTGAHNEGMYETDYYSPPQSSLPEKPHSKKRKSERARGRGKVRRTSEKDRLKTPIIPSVSNSWVTEPYSETDLLTLDSLHTNCENQCKFNELLHYWQQLAFLSYFVLIYIVYKVIKSISLNKWFTTL